MILEDDSPFINSQYNSFNHLLHYNKISSLIFLVMESLIIVFVIFRQPPKRVSGLTLDWVVAFIAMISPMFIMPTANEDDVLGLLIQIFGACLTIAGIIFLNRSFGIVPADRGIKTTGIYKIIRHPLYAGYILTDIGIIFNHFTIINLAWIILASVFLVIRILREEIFLIKNESYRNFKAKTRWRLIPYIW